MYRFFINDKPLHEDTVENLKIFSPHIELQQNTIQSFEFVIYPSNPFINEIKKITSTIKIYQGNRLLFIGRPIETEKGTKNSLKVYCECERAYLFDTIQEPYEYSGSIIGFLTMILENHNKQVDQKRQFKLGNVTVEDPNDYIVRSDTQWLNTWNTIQEKLIKLLGGYINIRHEKDGVYLDYLIDYTELNSQTVRFGENLLTVNRKEDSREIYTVLYPLGAKDENTGEQVTIESVNGGKKYIENIEGIERYGRIAKVMTWQDVTIPENLKKKAEETLQNSLYLVESIEMTAVDMASVKKDVSNFRIDSKIHVISNFHNINEMFVPMKISIYPFQASKNKITLNGTKKTLTETTNDNYNNVSTIIKVSNDTNIEIGKTNESLKKLNEDLAEAKTDITNIDNKINSINQNINNLNKHPQEKISQLIGVHGLRYYQNKLQTYIDEKWIDVNSGNSEPILTSNITYYVSTTGSDETGDGSQEKPFRTIQFAIDKIPKNMNGFETDIRVYKGNYDEKITMYDKYNGTVRLMNQDNEFPTIKRMDLRFIDKLYMAGFNIISEENESEINNTIYLSVVELYKCNFIGNKNIKNNKCLRTQFSKNRLYVCDFSNNHIALNVGSMSETALISSKGTDNNIMIETGDSSNGGPGIAFSYGNSEFQATTEIVKTYGGIYFKDGKMIDIQ